MFGHSTLFIVFVLFLSQRGTAAAWQDEATETALAAASTGPTVRVRSGDNSSRRIVALPLELYVARVLAGEGEPNAPDAAQQALAIAIRTYAAANMGRHRRDAFDLCDTTHCQVLRSTTPGSRRAALATAGQLLTYNGRPAEVFYSASCGGRSEAVSQVWPGAIDRPYLSAVDDDVHGDEAPWVVDIPASRIEQALRRAGFAGRRLKDLRIERRSGSNRVTLLQVSGMRPDTIAGDDFRLAIGARELRSTAFAVQKSGSSFRFTGRGYGHGVGMCVVGAGRRAARGESAAHILATYYPGLIVERVETTARRVDTSEGRPQQHPDGRVARDVDRIAQRARDELAATLGVVPPPHVTVSAHDSLGSFSHSTGRPWWVTTSVNGSTVELAPPAVLAQGDGLEIAIRRGVAELLVSGVLRDRPLWVTVGLGRYFAAPPPSGAGAIKHVACPTDAELTMAVSASAYRDAELRAEACFARAIATTRDWRHVR